MNIISEPHGKDIDMTSDYESNILLFVVSFWFAQTGKTRNIKSVLVHVPVDHLFGSFPLLHQAKETIVINLYDH